MRSMEKLPRATDIGIGIGIQIWRQKDWDIQSACHIPTKDSHSGNIDVVLRLGVVYGAINCVRIDCAGRQKNMHFILHSSLSSSFSLCRLRRLRKLRRLKHTKGIRTVAHVQTEKTDKILGNSRILTFLSRWLSFPLCPAFSSKSFLLNRGNSFKIRSGKSRPESEEEVK